MIHFLTTALDGSKRSPFIDHDLGRAHGLTIDLEESYLYWTDIDAMIIEKASLDDPAGTRRVVQRSDRYQPYSLAQYQVLLLYSFSFTECEKPNHNFILLEGLHLLV